MIPAFFAVVREVTFSRYRGMHLHFAPLLLLVLCETLLFLAERDHPVPTWAHMAAITMLTVWVFVLARALKKGEERVMSGLRLEITGMQQEMAKAARRYKSLLEGAGNAIFVFNAESGILEEVNRKGTELLGFSKEELSSKLGRDLLHSDEHERFRSFVYHLKRHGRAEIEALKFQKKDGSLFFGEVNGRLIDLGDERVAHCIVRDITDKRRTEKEIWQRNRELSILNNILTGMDRTPALDAMQQDTLREVMELFQAGGGTVHLTGAAGEPAELTVSLQISQRLAGEMTEAIRTQPEGFRELRVLKGGATGDLFRHAAADGWGSVTSVPLMVHDYLIGVMHLMHQSPHPYTGEELRFLQTAGNQMANVLEKNRLFAELNRKSGELLRSHRLLEKTSHNLSASEIKLKRNLALVEQANRELSRLARMKNQFLGMVSHEFNTPLTSILSGAEYLIQQARLHDGDVAVLEMVRDGGMRLKELVADLLKLIRLEARRDELDTSAVHLKHFLESMMEQLRPQLERRRQRVTLVDLDHLPHFEGDRDCLERVFGELLLNAIKYGPRGGEIEVSGRVVDKNELWARKSTLERFNPQFLKRCGDRCYLEVAVRDQGGGVPVEEQQGIFHIFYEVAEIRHHSSGSSRSQGKGAGLGLAMVKGMVEAHGGMVWVDNSQGSSFFLVLPMEQEASQPALF